MTITGMLRNAGAPQMDFPYGTGSTGVRLDLADGLTSAPDTLAEGVLGQVQGTPALLQPVAKGEGLFHLTLLLCWSYE